MDPHLQGYNPAATQGHGMRRLGSVITVWRIGLLGAGAVAVALLGEYTLPHAYQPSTKIGGFFGNIIASEQDAARPATVMTTQQVADANSMAQAKGSQQVLAATTAQQYGLAVNTPIIIASWFATGGCMYGQITGDSKWKQACGAAREFNASLSQQAGVVMDNLGTARAWGVPPQGSGMMQAADAEPLKQGEYDEIARLETSLKPGAVAQAKAGLNLETSRGERRYLALLTAMAGEPGHGADQSNMPQFEDHRTRRTTPAAPAPLPIPIAPPPRTTWMVSN